MPHALVSSVRRSLALALILAAAGACGGDDDGSVDAGPEAVPFDLQCDNPAAIMQAGGSEPSGFVSCDDGFIHRQDRVTCVIPEAPATCDSGGSSDTCTTSAECDDRPGGACLNGPSALEGCECVYGCETDGDCAAGEVCACAGVAGDWPTCIPAACRSDADCDGLCGLSNRSNGCSQFFYELGCLEEASGCRVECEETTGCYDNVGVPACEIVSGEWTCNIEDLCEDCG
jgi:hypothetical protein